MCLLTSKNYPKMTVTVILGCLAMAASEISNMKSEVSRQYYSQAKTNYDLGMFYMGEIRSILFRNRMHGSNMLTITNANSIIKSQFDLNNWAIQWVEVDNGNGNKRHFSYQNEKLVACYIKSGSENFIFQYSAQGHIESVIQHHGIFSVGNIYTYDNGGQVSSYKRDFVVKINSKPLRDFLVETNGVKLVMEQSRPASYASLNEQGTYPSVTNKNPVCPPLSFESRSVPSKNIPNWDSR